MTRRVLYGLLASLALVLFGSLLFIGALRADPGVAGGRADLEVLRQWLASGVLSDNSGDPSHLTKVGYLVYLRAALPHAGADQGENRRFLLLNAGWIFLGVASAAIALGRRFGSPASLFFLLGVLACPTVRDCADYVDERAPRDRSFAPGRRGPRLDAEREPLDENSRRRRRRAHRPAAAEYRPRRSPPRVRHGERWREAHDFDSGNHRRFRGLPRRALDARARDPRSSGPSWRRILPGHPLGNRRLLLETGRGRLARRGHAGADRAAADHQGERALERVSSRPRRTSQSLTAVAGGARPPVHRAAPLTLALGPLCDGGPARPEMVVGARGRHRRSIRRRSDRRPERVAIRTGRASCRRRRSESPLRSRPEAQPSPPSAHSPRPRRGPADGPAGSARGRGRRPRRCRRRLSLHPRTGRRRVRLRADRGVAAQHRADDPADRVPARRLGPRAFPSASGAAARTGILRLRQRSTDSAPRTGGRLPPGRPPSAPRSENAGPTWRDERGSASGSRSRAPIRPAAPSSITRWLPPRSEVDRRSTVGKRFPPDSEERRREAFPCGSRATREIPGRRAAA